MKTTCIRLNACIWLCCVMLLRGNDLKATVLNFFLECPPSVTINCYDDISDLDKWGRAYIWKNYVKTPTTPVKIIYNTNACGIGSITRYFEAVDPYGNTQKCNQVITVVGGTLFTATDINWPPYYTIEGCNPSTDPRTLPAPYDYPTFKKLKCAQPMYTYKDSKFTVSDGCMKILRDWKVIDWCQYQPNVYPSVGVWTYTQVIKLIVTDSTAKLICPLDTIVDSKADCKGTFVKLDSAKAISKCGFALNIRNTSPYSKSKGPDASGDYPLGTTEFYYTAEYGCGKEIKCKVKVTVRNKIGPVPYCLNGLITTLMPVDTNKDGTPDGGMIEIWAKDLNLGSYHPCGYKHLKFSFSSDTSYKSRIFTCDDLGKNDVQIWVTDSLGNQSFCKTYLEVQNNNVNIPDCKRKDSIKSTIVLSGLVTDDQNRLMQNIQMSLKSNLSTTIVPKIVMTIKTKYDTIVSKSGLKFYVRHNDTTYTTKYDTVSNQFQKDLMTDVNGIYLFKDLTKNETYQLNVNKRETQFKGITINDAIVLLRHTSGSAKIKDPYKLIAADINCDGVIDNLDFEMLYALVLGTKPYSELPKHWRFVPRSYVFKDPSNPLAESFDAAMNFDHISASKSHVDFIAIRVGELDGVSTIVNSPGISSRNSDVNNTGEFELINVFPNPVTDPTVHFEINVFKSNTLTLNLYDAQGNLLQRNSRSFDKGVQFWDFALDPLQVTGIFFYRISDGVRSQFGKLMRSK